MSLPAPSIAPAATCLACGSSWPKLEPGQGSNWLWQSLCRDASTRVGPFCCAACKERWRDYISVDEVVRCVWPSAQDYDFLLALLSTHRIVADEE